MRSPSWELRWHHVISGNQKWQEWPVIQGTAQTVLPRASDGVLPRAPGTSGSTPREGWTEKRQQAMPASQSCHALSPHSYLWEEGCRRGHRRKKVTSWDWTAQVRGPLWGESWQEQQYSVNSWCSTHLTERLTGCLSIYYRNIQWGNISVLQVINKSRQILQLGLELACDFTACVSTTLS